VKRHCVLFFLLQLQYIVYANNQTVEVPDQCIQKQESPCLVQSEGEVQFVWQSVHLKLQKNTIVELTKTNDSAEIRIQKGFVVAQSQAQFKIFGYNVQNKARHFVRVEGETQKILDSENFDLKFFSQFKDQNFVLERSEFLSKKKFILYLSSFYANSNDFKRDLSTFMAAYKKTLVDKSEKQDQFLKNRQAREIASIENAEIQRIANEKQKLDEKKRSRALYFMRTFKQ
jgi:hypothetical protein